MSVPPGSDFQDGSGLREVKFPSKRPHSDGVAFVREELGISYEWDDFMLGRKSLICGVGGRLRFRLPDAKAADNVGCEPPQPISRPESSSGVFGLVLPSVI
jgi:hypothetical protein